MGRRDYVAAVVLLLLALCRGAHPDHSPPLVPNDGERNDTTTERNEEHQDVNTTALAEERALHVVNETVTEEYGEPLPVNMTVSDEGHADVNTTLGPDAVDQPIESTVTDPTVPATPSPTDSTPPAEGRRPKQADAGGRRSGAPCPCDPDFGLRCSPDTRTCQGPLSLEVSEVGARSARVRWRSSAGLEPQAQVSIAPANGAFAKVQGGGAGGVSVGDLLPGHAYWVRVEEDGRHEAAEFTTALEPKVLVRALGPSSLTVAWDDFRPPSHDSHYTLLYRKEEEGEEWQQVQAGSRTMVSLSGLSPDSAYEVRVDAFDGGRRVDASEQVTARTQDGCVWEGRSVSVGETIPIEGAECGGECACAGGNRTQCAPRCAAPLFLRTAPPPHDPSCYEAPHEEDPCCAHLRCPESKFYGDEPGGPAHNKSGECPDLVSDSSCLSDCDRDADCADHLKCCPSACGGALCVPPARQPCDHVVCGPNAACGGGECACDFGFRGDPHDLDHGCQPVREGGTEAPFHLDLASEEENFHLNDTAATTRTAAMSDGCVFGNASFARGARFEAGCEARCVCEGRGRVTCAPRCRRPEEEEPAPGCRLRPDPEDPDCCTLAVCAFPGVRVVSAEALSGSAVRVRVDPPSSAVRAWVRRGGGAEWVSAGGGAADEEGALQVEGLQPATDYELRVTRDNDTSNTVQVRTLPPGSSAGVCVHEGRPLAAGEEVESGCEHRCVCRAGGLLECRDRCQVWVDAVGLEGCEWRPAPDDPCCTVPVCPPHAPPNLLPFPTGGVMGGGGARCEGEGGASYRAGDIWESGDGCRTTICRCGAQGVQCTSECPPPRCPAPHLTTPDCPCPVCPEHHSPPMLPPTTASPRACEFRGVPYAAGAEFRDGCAARCVCGADLRVQCAPLQCPPTPEGCLEWDEGGDDPCCPRCKHSGCVSEGVRRRPSEKWAEEGGRQCECLEGGRVRCCPRVPPRFLAPTERCPRPVIVTPDDPQMCPYVVCNNTAHGGEALEEEEEEQGELRAVSVVALNATAVRVRFSLPPSLVGGRGHAELRFSPDPSLAEGAWRAQRFSRPRRLFDSPHIEYVLGAGLEPSHTYYMRVRVRPDPPLPAPHDSALFKVTMPPPAAVRVDVRPMRAHPSSRGARITWRPLAHSERRLVDALLLQWRREGAGEWEETPPLHRDTSEWEVRGLQPASAYELRLLLRGEEGAPALEAAPGNTLSFTTTNATGEEPSLKASLVSVGGVSASFSVSPLPLEEEVRAARVRWGGGGEEGRSSYTAPPNASQPAVLEGLAPDTKYWAQLDLFLADGRALTSNRVEFKTKKADAAVSQEARSTEDGAGGGGVGALVAVAVVCGAAALAFALLLVVVVRRRGAAAPISRTPSEAAYDNPTYKTYDGERPENPSRENTLPLEK